MDAVNPLYLEANQLRWMLQTMTAATFAAAFLVLSYRLRRPLMNAFAALWSLQFLLALDNLVFWMRLPSSGGDQGLAFVSALVQGAVNGATAPVLLFAVGLITAGEGAASPGRATALRWVGALTMLSGATWWASTIVPSYGDALLALSSRCLFALPWVVAMWAARPSRAASPPPALRALVAACWLQVARIAVDAVLRLTPWPPDYAALVSTVIVFGHILVVLSVGIITVYVSLEHERQLVLEQARLLEMARAREGREERLSSLGRFASGVAHDFNNILTVIVSSVELIRMDAETPPPTRTRAEAITAASERGTALVRQLLDFARDRPAMVSRFLPGDVLEKLSGLLARLIGGQCEVRWRLHGTYQVEMDPSRFERVIMNLVSNARDAMPHGGHLTIEVTDASAAGPGRDAGTAPRRYVRLSVSDTGTGIAPDVLPRIFEPFATTKEGAGGTGLGLANVDRIVQDAGGHVAIKSTPGLGTRFDIWLPAVEESPIRP